MIKILSTAKSFMRFCMYILIKSKLQISTAKRFWRNKDNLNTCGKIQSSKVINTNHYWQFLYRRERWLLPRRKSHFNRDHCNSKCISLSRGALMQLKGNVRLSERRISTWFLLVTGILTSFLSFFYRFTRTIQGVLFIILRNVFLLVCFIF